MVNLRLSLLELHGDIRIGPKSMDSLFEEEEEIEEKPEDQSPLSTGEDESRSRGIAVVAGLVFLILLGIAAGKLLGEETKEELDKPVELAESDDL